MPPVKSAKTAAMQREANPRRQFIHDPYRLEDSIIRLRATKLSELTACSISQASLAAVSLLTPEAQKKAFESFVLFVNSLRDFFAVVGQMNRFVFCRDKGKPTFKRAFKGHRNRRPCHPEAVGNIGSVNSPFWKEDK